LTSTASLEDTLRQIPLFAGWPGAALQALAAAGRRLHCRRRTPLLHDRARREVLAVVSGVVEISRTSPEGRKHLLTFLVAGTVAPLVRLLEDTSLEYTYTAQAGAVVVCLPCEALLAVLDATPLLWRDIARAGLLRQRDSVAQLQAQALGSLRQRVAATLLSLARDTGTPLRDGQQLPMKLSQADLATMLGVSRQTLNKTLRPLAEEGIANLSYRRVTFLDAAALERAGRDT